MTNRIMDTKEDLIANVSDKSIKSIKAQISNPKVELFRNEIPFPDDIFIQSPAKDQYITCVLNGSFDV